MATIGVKLELNSQEFAQGMRQATSEVKLLNTQLKGLTSSMTSSGSAFSKHQQKTELLTNKLGALKNEQSLLSAKLEEAKAKWGENSAQANNYAQKLERVNQDIATCESELKAQGGTLGAVGAQFSAIGETLKNVGDKMSQMGTTLTQKVTMPLVAVGAVGAKKFAEVDKTMQLTYATMGTTEKEAQKLKSAMESAASASTFGMNDAAQATLNFARAGLSADQAASALAPAMNLAAAEGGNLDTVSAGLVATINGFGGTFDQAAQYADTFANACNNSALDIEGLSTSMSVAAPVFSAAGYSVKDAALYMGTMANKGIEASVAANSLKTGFARLVGGSKEVQTQLDKLGVSVVNTDGSLKDTVTIQKDLNQAFSGLSESEQIAAASAIFGKNQMSNWLALINTAPEEVNALSQSLDTEGTTAAQAEAMMSGFGGSMEALKSKIDVAATALGESLAPTISKVADKIQKAVDWFNSLNDEQKQTVAKIAVVVAAIGPVLFVVGKVISLVGMVSSGIGAVLSVIGPLITAIGAINIAMTPTTLIIIGIIAAIVALIAIGVLLYKNWDTIKEKCAELVSKVKEKLLEMANAVKEKLDTIKSTFSNIFNGIKQLVTIIFGAIYTTIKSKMDFVKSTIQSILGIIKSLFTGDLASAKEWGHHLIDNFVNGIKEKIQLVKDTVTNVAKTVKDILGFSEPKKGPLSNFHTFGPDMMKLYSKGIEDYAYLVRNAVGDVAVDVASLNGAGLDTDAIYNAVRDGSSDAEIGLSIGEREFTRVLRGLGVVFNA